MTTIPAEALALEIPQGYQPLELLQGFAEINGPVYWRSEDDGGVCFGMRIEDRHCNPLCKAHGGLIATFLDMVMPLSVRFTVPEFEERFLLTVTLNIDYLAPVSIGDWLEGRARILRQTKRMLFVDAVLTVGSEITARANTVLRVGPAAPRIR